MASFDDRQRAFEKKFTHDAELQFKAEARRNKLLAAWAAEQFGMTGEARDGYVSEVILSDLKEAGDDDVFRKVKGDFESRGVQMDDAQLRAKMDEYYAQAKQQLSEE